MAALSTTTGNVRILGTDLTKVRDAIRADEILVYGTPGELVHLGRAVRLGAAEQAKRKARRATQRASRRNNRRT